MSVFPKSAFLAILIALAVYATPAMATPPASLQVSLHDLDFRDEADAETAYRRIRSAAQRVCRQEHQFGADYNRAVRTCAHAVVNQAVSQLNSSQLNVLHTRHTNPVALANTQGHAPS